MKHKLYVLLVKLGLIPANTIHYIGGADVLPPPLKGADEQAALEALEQKTVRLQKRQAEARAHEKNRQSPETKCWCIHTVGSAYRGAGDSRPAAESPGPGCGGHRCTEAHILRGAGHPDPL